MVCCALLWVALKVSCDSFHKHFGGTYEICARPEIQILQWFRLWLPRDCFFSRVLEVTRMHNELSSSRLACLPWALSVRCENMRTSRQTTNATRINRGGSCKERWKSCSLIFDRSVVCMHPSHKTPINLDSILRRNHLHVIGRRCSTIIEIYYYWERWRVERRKNITRSRASCRGNELMPIIDSLIPNHVMSCIKQFKKWVTMRS